MAPRAPLPLAVGDVVELRKPHPCGGKLWRISRVGADIGAECLTCRRYILTPRSRFEMQIKRFISRAEETPDLDLPHN
ncbi:MAG TPA: DUF951 domain-containing protein [Anaerolineae bacterium]|nr:DUF951 domain-containing protein [Anaerolineae bacterium]